MICTANGSSSRYYEHLKAFVEFNERMVNEGMPYIAVMLCHELFRFMYPVEPYAGFKHDDPVEFITNHIKKLMDSAERFSDVLTPYDLDLGKMDSSLSDEILERATSKLYSELWSGFDDNDLSDESLRLLEARLSDNIIKNNIIGKKVLDMGCGSGRYSIALAKMGARQVIGVDLENKSFNVAKKWCEENHLPVEFQEGNVHELPFNSSDFDFVYCNGVLHHTSSIEKGLKELHRVLKDTGRAFLYLYASGGIFWDTRAALRQVFKRIPINYTKAVLAMIGMPSNRFIFCDTWYVPVETLTTNNELNALLAGTGFRFEKIAGKSPFDLDGAIESKVKGGKEMWGDGEHRYILFKKAEALC